MCQQKKNEKKRLARRTNKKLNPIMKQRDGNRGTLWVFRMGNANLRLKIKMWGYFRTHPLCMLDETLLKSKTEKKERAHIHFYVQHHSVFSSQVLWEK